jgi:transposase
MKLTLSNLRSDYKLIYKVHPNTAMRISALIELVKISNEFKLSRTSAGKRIKTLALCQGLDISIRTLFRWKASYKKNGFVGLTKKKALGKLAVEPTDLEKFLMREMREKYRWGSEVIQAHLKRDHSVSLTRHKIERFLRRSGLRDEFPCTTKKRRLNIKKVHTRVVKVHNPGDHTQMDTKHQPHILQNGEKCYVFNFIDHASNWSFKRAYSKINPKSTIDFMNRLLEVCPFKIQRLQTDNGTEYTYKFYKRYMDIKKEHPLEIFCENNNIVQKLIPPGVKELQGLVERSHRQDDQELFSRIEPLEIDSFNESLEEFYISRNKSRRFKKLDWSTADEWLIEYNTVQRALRYGHRLNYGNKGGDLLPFHKISKMPKSSNREEFLVDKKVVNSSKDKKKSVDTIYIKKVA